MVELLMLSVAHTINQCLMAELLVNNEYGKMQKKVVMT
jgi:hypothetical protein